MPTVSRIELDDEVGGDGYIIECHDDGLVHHGAIPVRPTLSVNTDLWRTLGVAAECARAIEFVLHWFGTPFDFVSLTVRPRRALAWGCWSFTGETLDSCLRELTSRNPDTLRATGGEPGARSPELVARLARLARHPDAQLMQLKSIAERIPLPSNGGPQGARDIAAYLYIEHALGSRAAALSLQSPDTPSFLGRLEHSGRVQEWANVLRILASPELRE